MISDLRFMGPGNFGPTISNGHSSGQIPITDDQLWHKLSSQLSRLLRGPRCRRPDAAIPRFGSPSARPDGRAAARGCGGPMHPRAENSPTIPVRMRVRINPRRSRPRRRQPSAQGPNFELLATTARPRAVHSWEQLLDRACGHMCHTEGNQCLDTGFAFSGSGRNLDRHGIAEIPKS